MKNYKNKHYFFFYSLILLISVLILKSCSKDDGNLQEDTLYITMEGGDEEEYDLCDCNGNGSIYAGGCLCDPGYEGDSCQFVSTDLFTGQFYDPNTEYKFTVTAIGEIADSRVEISITQPFNCSFYADVKNKYGNIPPQYYCVNEDSLLSGSVDVVLYNVIYGYIEPATVSGGKRGFDLYFKLLEKDGSEFYMFTHYLLIEE